MGSVLGRTHRHRWIRRSNGTNNRAKGSPFGGAHPLRWISRSNGTKSKDKRLFIRRGSPTQLDQPIQRDPKEIRSSPSGGAHPHLWISRSNGTKESKSLLIKVRGIARTIGSIIQQYLEVKLKGSSSSARHCPHRWIKDPTVPGGGAKGIHIKCGLLQHLGSADPMVLGKSQTFFHQGASPASLD